MNVMNDFLKYKPLISRITLFILNSDFGLRIQELNKDQSFTNKNETENLTLIVYVLRNSLKQLAGTVQLNLKSW